MTKEEILKNLEELIEDRESFIDDDPTCDIFKRDAETLREAIKLISDVRQGKLDRSRWEGCGFCTYELNDYPFVCACGENGCGDSEYIPAYCPNCGTPLTKAAWAELEGRIGGNEKADIY